MTISNEWNLLNKITLLIKDKSKISNHHLIKGIGDDCSIFSINDESFGLITTDMSIEGSHFICDLTCPEDIGYRAMVANISDIAAMGGKPKFAFVSLGIPASCKEEYVESLYNGMVDAGNSAGLIIAGGDISKSSEIVLNIALYGEVNKNRVIKRSGAAHRDIIYMTGFTGRSQAGLDLLLSRKGNYSDLEKDLMRCHHRPSSPFRTIDSIIDFFNPSSMIDISDGLLSDIRHICCQSNCGFIIHRDKLPLDSKLNEFCRLNNKNPFEFILNSGEEYQLLFTSKKVIDNNLPVELKDISITPIGEITSEEYLIKDNDIIVGAPSGGFNHFKG